MRLIMYIARWLDEHPWRTVFVVYLVMALVTVVVGMLIDK